MTGAELLQAYLDELRYMGYTGVHFTNSWDMTRDVLLYGAHEFGLTNVPVYFAKDVHLMVSRIN